MKMKSLMGGLLPKHERKPVAKVAVEPLFHGSVRSNGVVNPLQLRGLFVG